VSDYQHSTDKDRKEWKAMCDEAPPGPWTRCRPDRDKTKRVLLWSAKTERPIVKLNGGGGYLQCTDSMLWFLENSITILPRLIADVERLEKDRDRLLALSVELAKPANGILTGETVIVKGGG